MNSIFPAIRPGNELLMAAQDTAWHIRIGFGGGAAKSYFATSGSVQIGPYSGHLRYLPSPLPHGPTQAIAELDEEVQRQRGLCRKLFDKVFRGIGLDGQKRMSVAQACTFRIVDDAFERVVNALRRDSHAKPAEDIAFMAGTMYIMRDPSAALDRVRAAGPKNNHAELIDIVKSMSVPIVAEAAWRDIGTIRRLVSLCTASRHIYRLAETGDTTHQRSALAGLRRMLDDDAIVQNIADTLANEIRGMSFQDARNLVLPYIVHGEHASFAMDRAGRNRVPQLWIALRETVATSEDAATLANDHARWGLAPYHCALDFVLSDAPTRARIQQSIIDSLHVGPGGGQRIGMETARKVAAFLTGALNGEPTPPGTILSRSALQSIWGDPVISAAIDRTARDAMMAPGIGIELLQTLVRTHPNKAYIAQYFGISPFIGSWHRAWTNQFGAREELHADPAEGPQLADAAARTFAVA